MSYLPPSVYWQQQIWQEYICGDCGHKMWYKHIRSLRKYDCGECGATNSTSMYTINSAVSYKI